MTASAPVARSGEHYKCFRQFNDAPCPAFASSRSSITEVNAARYFPAQSLPDKLVRSLGAERAVPIKEILEAFEFFARVRKEVRATNVADLCCGHGLVGILFAVFERRVEFVVLIDECQPPSFERLLAATARVAPWVADKVKYRSADIATAQDGLEPGTTIVSTHACGVLTDRCIDCAISVGGSIAVMPCCYPRAACEAPQAVRLALGMDIAFDVHRTYKLENAGYHVRWTAIPEDITPMNRILVGRKPARATGGIPK